MSVIYHDDIEQGTEEWKAFRARFLTGTDAIQVLRGKDIDELLASKQVGSSFNGNHATRRGHRLEPEAIAIFEAIKDFKVHHTGFITNTKYPIAGYSPDGLIGDDGIAECKAFSKQRHLENAIRPEVHIIAQVQWGMFVSERKYAYLIFYNPDLEPEQAIFIIKINRSEPAMKRFASLIEGY